MAKKRFPDASPRVTGKTWEDVRPELQEFLDKLVFAIVNVAGSPADISSEISARGAADVLLSNRISNLTSAHNALSNVVSNIISAGGGGTSVTSNELSAVSAQAASALNVTSNVLSNLISAHNALSNRVSANSGGSASVTSTELSNVLSVANAASNAASVVSQALSVAAAALSVRIDTQSQGLSVHSQQISVLSQQVSALSQAHSALSQTVSVLSNVVSNETSNRISADNALSQAISVVSNAVSVVSQAVSAELSNRVSADNALSVRIDTQSQAISVLSQGLSALSQAHSVLSQAVSNEISNRTSADNALSVRIDTQSQGISVISQQVSALSQAHSVLSQALSNEISNRVSADNVLSLRLQSILSVDISAISQQVSALSQALSVLSSIVSNLNSAHNVLSNRVSANSGTGGSGSVTSNEVSAGDASVFNAVRYLSLRNVDAAAVSAGAPVYLDSLSAYQFKKGARDANGTTNKIIGLVADNSIAVSAVGRIQTAGLIVRTTAEWDAITGGAGGLNTGSRYKLGNTAGTLTTLVSVTDGLDIMIGLAMNTTDLLLQIESGGEQLAYLGNATSALLSAVGVLNLDKTISLQNVGASVASAGRAVFLFTSANTFKATKGAAGNPTSANAIGLVADNSIAISAVGRIQVNGVMSLTSALWDEVTGGSTGLTPGAIYYVGTGIAITGLGDISTVPTVFPRPVGIALDGNHMLIKTQLDQGLQDLISANYVSADNVLSLRMQSILSVDISVLSQQVSVISQQVSVLSQALSVISVGGLSRPQVKAATNIQIISAVALTNVSGLSISVAGSGAVYRVMGCLMYTLSVAASPIKFGATWPGTVVAAGQWVGFMSVPAAGVTGLSTTVAAAGLFNGGASGSIVYSAAGGTSATVYAAFLEAVFVISTAGTIQLQAGASTTTGAIHIQQGSYIQAFRIV